MSRREKWIVFLLVSGWVLPTVWPGYGIPIAANTHYFQTPNWFFRTTGLIYSGFFSQGCIVCFNWEGSHGSSYPQMWLPGFLPGLAALVSSLCILLVPRTRKLFLGINLILLAGGVLIPLYFLDDLAKTFFIHAAVLTGFTLSCVLTLIASRICLQRYSQPRVYNWACSLLLFHFLCILTLAIAFGIIPFLGWGCTMTGLILLLTTQRVAVRTSTHRPDIADYLTKTLLVATVLAALLFLPVYSKTVTNRKEFSNGVLVKEENQEYISEHWQWRLFLATTATPGNESSGGISDANGRMIESSTTKSRTLFLLEWQLYLSQLALAFALLLYWWWHIRRARHKGATVSVETG